MLVRANRGCADVKVRGESAGHVAALPANMHSNLGPCPQVAPFQVLYVLLVWLGPISPVEVESDLRVCEKVGL